MCCVGTVEIQIEILKGRCYYQYRLYPYWQYTDLFIFKKVFFLFSKENVLFRKILTWKISTAENFGLEKADTNLLKTKQEFSWKLAISRIFITQVHVEQWIVLVAVSCESGAA